MPTTLTIPVEPDFSLPHTVCSYGYFILAPNFWHPATATLHRPLRLDADHVTHARIDQPREDTLRVRCDPPVARADHAALKAQIARMLRLDERFTDWRRLHPAARAARFDRIFRSPSLFEDIVKTITGCNVAWPNTIRMNRLLCEHVSATGDFPTPAELAALTTEQLAQVSKVGYRAGRIIQLARDVHEGRLDLAWFEPPGRTVDELYQALRRIHGIGDYAARNLLQLLGHYRLVPVDSETRRHLRLHHPEADDRRIEELAAARYAPHAPYQFLAYWFELWQDYQRRFGPAPQWTSDIHQRFTARYLK